MAKWGSQSLDDLHAVRLKLVETQRDTEEHGSNRPGASAESRSGLGSVPEEQWPTVEGAFETSGTPSPFAAASELAPEVGIAACFRHKHPFGLTCVPANEAAAERQCSWDGCS